MPLDPQARQLLRQLEKARVQPFFQLSPAEARAQMLLGSRFLGPSEPVHHIEDRELPGEDGTVPVRVYRPGPESGLPIVVFLHGGGWVTGSIETHDGYCRALANRAGVLIVSVEYRLAPEHKFPAAVTDAFAATRWVAEHAAELGGDAARLAVMGDSAGGNLAAAVTLSARQAGTPRLRYQVLVYPVLDYQFDTGSYRENAEGYHLTRQDMIWSWRHYLQNELDGFSPLASPLQAPDLGGLPPALIVTAEFDPLRDEGEAYARRLAEAGVAVQLRRYDGMIHGFARRFIQLDRARGALDEVAQSLRAALIP
jgi:acetyl esterase